MWQSYHRTSSAAAVAADAAADADAVAAVAADTADGDDAKPFCQNDFIICCCLFR